MYKIIHICFAQLFLKVDIIHICFAPLFLKVDIIHICFAPLFLKVENLAQPFSKVELGDLPSRNVR